MIPIQLKLRNFMSYRDEATLDFTALRVACLAGDNGAGKSALLDAITWSLWGKTRANNDRDVITIGEHDMEVSFTFQLREREYRIFRRRVIGSRASQSLEFDARAVGGDEWTSISGDNVRQTERKIAQTLNLDYETFVNSAFILQGQADAFTQKTPGERKKILADILNLDQYDELAKDARDEQRDGGQTVARLRGQIEALDRRLVERPARLEELEVVTARLNDVGAKLDLARELARSLAQQLQAWEQLDAQLAAANQRLAREQASLAGIDARVAAEQRERERFAAVLADADAIERDAAEYERWRATADQFAVTLRGVQAQISIQNAADTEIRDAANTLQRQRDRQQAAERQACEALKRLAREGTQLAELEAELAADADAGQRLVNVRAALEELRAERSDLHAANQRLKQDMEDIRTRLDDVERGEANCPVCRRPLAPDDRARVAAEWRADGETRRATYRANRERLSVIDANGKGMSELETQLVERDRNNAGRRALIDQLRAGLADRDVHERVASDARAEIARIDALLAAEEYAPEARARRSAAESELERLAYDGVAHDHANAQTRALEPARERLRELETARAQHASVEQSLAALAEQRAERQQAVDETLAEVERLVAQHAANPDLRERAQTAADACDTLEAEQSECWSKHGAVESALAELDRLEAERDELATRVKALDLDLGALGQLVQAFGRNGIQAMIVENVLPELEDEANRLLQRMSSGQLRVSFRSTRQALSSDDTLETLDIIIRDEYGERPYALYSGGEAFRVNFAVRVALSKLLARRAGARIDVLVIDEGFGTQDSRGRDGLIEALRSIEEDFSTILVITHIGEIREMFPNRIDITKTERGSMISVN